MYQTSWNLRNYCRMLLSGKSDFAYCILSCMAKVTNTKHPDSSVCLLITLKWRYKRDWLRNKLDCEGAGHQTALRSSFYFSNSKILTSDLHEQCTDSKHTVTAVTKSARSMNVESKGLSQCCLALRNANPECLYMWQTVLQAPNSWPYCKP
jgi:hypothetical protein